MRYSYDPSDEAGEMTNSLHLELAFLSTLDVSWNGFHVETSNNPLILPVVAVFAYLVFVMVRRAARAALIVLGWNSRSNTSRAVESKQPLSWPAVAPLPDFEWKRTEPRKLRPFKPIYHLSMGVQRCDPSTLVEMDNTYLDRLRWRRQTMEDRPEITLAANTVAAPAVTELYDWLMSAYLPTRFLTLYRLEGHDLHCLVTDECFPVSALAFQYPAKPKVSGNQHEPSITALRTLSSIIDTEFLILLPKIQPDGTTKYVLEAFAVCSPSGFNTRAKLNLPLASIHTPVPAYEQKLKISMDRYFDRLEVGKWVQRANWTITTHDKLFTPGDAEDGAANHWKPGDPLSKDGEGEQVDPEKCFLRSESQKLFRMPGGAIVFAFKTYLYDLPSVKAEGEETALALAEAIEGMRKGNAPDVWYYKRAFEWGLPVVRWLREGWDGREGGSTVGSAEAV